ncbi:MAG: DUF5615 family PIN-like protein [Inquilinus sp.]|nr:DUF5615 family PIN-like protein [Inquilinus sp.]
MRLFIDECLSPRIARDLNETGLHVAEHPLDYGGRGQRDDQVLARAYERDLIIVTENAGDFRRLVGAADLHPGLIILPNVGRQTAAELLDAAIAFLEARGDPADAMVNHVLEVAEDGEIAFRPLPPP